MIQAKTVVMSTESQWNHKKNKKNMKKKPIRVFNSVHQFTSQPTPVQTKRIKGKPPSFLEARKESYLNSCYKKRRRALEEVMRQNHRLYKRINTQQSQYCSEKSLAKSCVSKKSIQISRNSKHKLNNETVLGHQRPILLNKNNYIKGKGLKQSYESVNNIEGTSTQMYGKIFQVKSEHFIPASCSNGDKQNNIPDDANTKLLQDIDQFNDRNLKAYKSTKIYPKFSRVNPSKNRRIHSAVQNNSKSSNYHKTFYE